jgi:hypothetical protein
VSSRSTSIRAISKKQSLVTAHDSRRASFIAPDIPATDFRFEAEDRATLTLSSGKQFLFQTFRL